MANPTNHCPDCNLPLPAGNDGVGCPHCLLLLAFDDPDSTDTIHKQKPPPAGLKSRFFGNYEIEEEIARGGMGIVFRARDLKLKRVVALKMIQPGHLASPEARMRFNLEVSAVAGLNHRNIVPLLESGEHEGSHFYTMALIEGANLAAHIRNHAVPTTRDELSRVVGLISKTCHAVHHAHQHGIIHRDVKPANILLDGYGEPHVSDFGLARVTEGDSGITYSNTVLGSPNYMAPEQARRERGNITTSVDVYGLGAVLYEALTGKPPFQAATPLATIRKVLDEDAASPRRLNPAIDADLETICLKCLQKEPTNRYASAEELADDLERWRSGHTIHARPVSALTGIWRWSRRHPTVAGLSIALVIALLAITAGSLLALQRISRAEAEASDHLRESVLNQARTLRLAGRMGMRTESMALIKKASEMGGNPDYRARLRNEALAAMALSDMQFRTIAYLPPDERATALIDPLMIQVVSIDQQSNLVARLMSGGNERFRLPFQSNGRSRLGLFNFSARFLTVTDDRHTAVWDLLEGRKLDYDHDPEGVITFAHHGPLMLTQDRIESLSYRRLPSMELFREIPNLDRKRRPNPRWFKFLEIVPDGTMVLAVQRDHPVLEAINPDGRLLWEVVFQRKITALALDRLRRRAMVATDDGTIRFLNWRNGEMVGSVSLSSPAVRLASSDVSELMAAVTRDQTLHLWQEASLRQTIAIPGAAPQLRFTPEGLRLGTITRGDRVGWLDLSSSSEFAEYLVGSITNRIVRAEFDPVNDLIGVACQNSFLLMSPVNGAIAAELKLNDVRDCTVSSKDGTWFLADDQGVVQWKPFPAPDRYAYNPESSRAIRNTNVQRVAIVDETALAVATGARETVQVYSIPGFERREPTHSEGHRLGLLDPDSGNQRPDVPFPDGTMVGAFAVSPEENLIAVVVDLFDIHLFDGRNRERIGILRTPVVAPIKSLRFNHEGTQLLAVVPGRIRVWNIPAMRNQLESLELDWDLPARL